MIGKGCAAHHDAPCIRVNDLPGTEHLRMQRPICRSVVDVTHEAGARVMSVIHVRGHVLV
jgi:hypothetical protein